MTHDAPAVPKPADKWFSRVVEARTTPVKVAARAVHIVEARVASAIVSVHEVRQAKKKGRRVGASEETSRSRP